ncbi:MAG: phytoene/squalene synthase family protein [Chloroflexi bacterium]|nr:phytoene/squalene synthase family protein [Chloroflexota bacterium]
MGLSFSSLRAASIRSEFESLMGAKARTFALAARFLDPERRRATEVLYAFFRTLDDLVDERPIGADPAPIAAELADWDRWLAQPRQADGDPLKQALAETLETYAIPPRYLRVLILGLREDLAGHPMASFDDLERYSFRVAGSVGLAMCHVLGATSRTALLAAASLGIAMQLTNILRDVADDLSRGRVYLPADELERFGCHDALIAGSLDDPLRALLRFQIARARRYYEAGTAGIAELPLSVRYPIALAALLYGRILDCVEAQGYDVFSHRAALSRRRKVLLAGRVAIAMQMERHRIPLPLARRAAAPPPMIAFGASTRAELAACGAWVLEPSDHARPS